MTSNLHTLEKLSMHQVKYLIYENLSDCVSEHPLHFLGLSQDVNDFSTSALNKGKN
jgi:hypothetical protein